jgi:hypothetical protein
LPDERFFLLQIMKPSSMKEKILEKGTTSPNTNYRTNHSTKFPVKQKLHWNLQKPPFPNNYMLMSINT